MNRPTRVPPARPTSPTRSQSPQPPIHPQLPTHHQLPIHSPPRSPSPSRRPVSPTPFRRPASPTTPYVVPLHTPFASPYTSAYSGRAVSPTPASLSDFGIDAKDEGFSGARPTFMAFLKKNFEHRLQSLIEQLTETAGQLVRDTAISVMSQDPVSANYVHSRVYEIVEESLMSEREVYIEELLHTLSNKEVEALDMSRDMEKEMATLKAKLQQKEELLSLEKERVYKLEQELAHWQEQDSTSTNLRSVVHELLARVNSESVSKADILAELNKAVLDLRNSLFPFTSSPQERRITGDDMKHDREGYTRKEPKFSSQTPQQNSTMQLGAPHQHSEETEGTMRLREWITQLNACKAQNEQLHSKLAAALLELEDRDNQVHDLKAQYATLLNTHPATKLREGEENPSIAQWLHAQPDLTPEQQSKFKKLLEEKSAEVSAAKAECSYLSNKIKGYGVMLEELVGRARGKAGVRSRTPENSRRVSQDVDRLIEELVKLQLGSISTSEHEEILASKLSLLEQQMYSECKDLMHALEERKNNEYTTAMGSVRQGVKRLEDTLEEERAQNKALQLERGREQLELEAAKVQLESLGLTHSSTSQQLEQTKQKLEFTAQQLTQVTKSLSDTRSELEKERNRSLSLSQSIRTAMSDSTEKSSITQLDGAPSTVEIRANVRRTVSTKLASLQAALITTLEHECTGGDHSNIRSRVLPHTLESAVVGSFQAISDIIHASHNETLAKCAESERKLLQSQELQSLEFAQFKTASSSMHAQTKRTLQQMQSVLTVGIVSLQKELSTLKTLVQRDIMAISQHAANSLMKYQMNIQRKIAHTEEQHTRALYQESHMKTSVANLDQKMANLLLKNEQLSEKNAQLTEKNSTYVMEIESLREECESYSSQVLKLREQCEAAAQAHALVSTKLEQVHAELNIVTASLPVNQVPSKPSPQLMRRKMIEKQLSQNELVQRSQSPTKELQDHSTVELHANGDIGGRRRSGSFNGLDGTTNSKWSDTVRGVQGAQQLHDKFIDFASAFQEDKQKTAAEQRELTQQINNLAQLNSLIIFHVRDLVALICDNIPGAASLAAYLLPVVDVVNSIATTRALLSQARPHFETVRSKLFGLVEERDRLQQQLKDTNTTRVAAGRECEDLRRQLKEAKTEKLTATREFDGERQQFKELQLSLTLENKELQISFTQVKEQHMLLVAENKDLQASLSHLKSEKSTLNLSADDMRVQLSTALKRIDDLTQQLQDTQALLGHMKTEKAAHVRNVEELRLQAKGLNDTIRTLTGDAQEYRHQVELLQASLEDAKMEHATLSNKLQGVRLKVQELKEEKQVAETEADSLRQQLKDALASVERTTKEKNTLSQHGEELRLQSRELSAVRSTLTEEVQDLREQQKDTIAALAQALTEKSSLASKVEDLRKEVKAAIVAKQASSRDADDLLQQLQELQGTLGHTKADKEHLAQAVDELKLHVKDLISTKDAISRENSDLHAQLKTMHQQYNETNALKEELKQHLKELHARVNKDSASATQEAEILHHQIKELLSSKAIATQVTDSLKHQVKELTARLQKLTTDNSSMSTELRELQELVKQLRMHNEQEVGLKVDVQQEAEGLRQQVKDMTSQVKRLNLEKVALSRELENLDSLLKDSQSRNNTASREVEQVKRQLGDVTLQWDDAKVACQSVVRELEECKSKLKDTRLLLKEEKQGKTATSQELLALRTQLNELQARYMDSENEQQVITNEAEAIRQRYNEAQIRLGELKTERSTLILNCTELRQIIKDLQGKLDDTKSELLSLHHRSKAEKDAKTATEKELGKVKNSLYDQENKKNIFLSKVHDKDREIAKLHELLEKSFKEVTVEGIMTASQLEAKTQQLAKRTAPKAVNSRLKSNGRQSPLNASDHGVFAGTDSSTLVMGEIDDLSSIEVRSSNTPLQ